MMEMSEKPKSTREIKEEIDKLNDNWFEMGKSLGRVKAKEEIRNKAIEWCNLAQKDPKTALLKCPYNTHIWYSNPEKILEDTAKIYGVKPELAVTFMYDWVKNFFNLTEDEIQKNKSERVENAN